MKNRFKQSAVAVQKFKRLHSIHHSNSLHNTRINDFLISLVSLTDIDIKVDQPAVVSEHTPVYKSLLEPGCTHEDYF